MKLWLIFVQGDDTTWLEAAWDDQSVENCDGYDRDVDRVRQMAHENGYELRIIVAEVPGVFEAFEIPLKHGEVHEVRG